MSQSFESLGCNKWSRVLVTQTMETTDEILLNFSSNMRAKSLLMDVPWRGKSAKIALFIVKLCQIWNNKILYSESIFYDTIIRACLKIYIHVSIWVDLAGMIIRNNKVNLDILYSMYFLFCCRILPNNTKRHAINLQ